MIVKNKDGKTILNRPLSDTETTEWLIRSSRRMAGIICLIAGIASVNTLFLLALFGLYLYQFPEGQAFLRRLLQLHQFYSLLGTATLGGLFLALFWLYKKLFEWWINRYEKKTLKIES